ncbi:hypothetical protein CP533_6495 [Ophiocordyceps camponoti-saundersi (nom. inval.)]|nr:hypothetical protein CP533_6495 [Ophiocordyceps camponoti-saundersi (nom. inval.)]
MWPSTLSVQTLTRPRLAVAIVSSIAAISAFYFVHRSKYDSFGSETQLARSNAVRRTRRRSRRIEPGSSSASEAAGDENANNPVEAVVNVGADEWWNDIAGSEPTHRTGHNMVNLLFRVSEDNARKNGSVHRGCQCNSCGMVPIRGVRYRCANCPDFDLCETCESQGVHTKTHIFYKIKVPAPPFGPRQMQPVWYTGNPDSQHRNPDRPLINKLVRDTGFERTEVEAFWLQWTFLAATEWREDPDELGIAMDRKTFERCLVPTGGSRHAAPNLIHDRMFSFYDANGDGLISFPEFLHGLSYRKRKDKLRKVFEGYDIDGDGFVDRRDFLRMFRAYYVLYKQMHRDILEGLGDQLLASPNAAQAIYGRQPLSAVFGRDGRVPPADGNMRFEGKTFHRDGSVVVDDPSHGVTVESRTDTATRDEILTSLFAYESLQQPRRRFVAQPDADANWRTVRRLSANDADRAYWVTLLDPPINLGQLPDALAGANLRDVAETDDEAELDREDEHDNVDGARLTDDELRFRMLRHARRQVPKMERRRRDMARRQLHERWRRRQFYLDQEEGGVAPEGFNADDDMLAQLSMAVEDVQTPAQTRSRSSSKVRFAEDMDDYETRSNPSTSSRSIPERWGGMGVPEAERDAGKEILYQVTQQAFNELLDTIFMPAEDLAAEAAESKEFRAKYRAEIESVHAADEGIKRAEADPQAWEKANRDKSAEDAVSEAILAAAEQAKRPNEDELEQMINLSDDTIPSESSNAGDDEHRDPTMPQHRPSGGEKVLRKRKRKRPDSTEADAGEDDPSSSADRTSTDESIATSSSLEPSVSSLRRWKELDEAEAKAAARGGWGRLNFEEFEIIYKYQEDQGNRLDYLGSWIDFCIP